MKILLIVITTIVLAIPAIAAILTADEFTEEPKVEEREMASSKKESVEDGNEDKQIKRKAKKARKCYRCHGKGKVIMSVKEPCDRCEGSGVLVSEVILKNKRWAGDYYGTEKKALNRQPCPLCHRSGKVSVKQEVECSSCNGTGKQ